MELNIKFHPLFIIFAFILIFFGWCELFVTYFVVMMLHEYAHYLTAHTLGYKLNKILFMPYGVSLSGNTTFFKRKDEMMIALAGPLANIIIVAVTVCLWWVVPISYHYTQTFVYANLSLGLFNLIPLFPLDGGRLMVGFLSKKIRKYKIIKVMKLLSVVIGIFFCVLCVISLFDSLNLTYFFTGVFLISSCMDGNKNYVYERSFLNKNNAVSEIKTYIVNKNTQLHTLSKYITGNYYVQFYVVDDNYKVVKILTEHQLLKLLTEK